MHTRAEKLRVSQIPASDLAADVVPSALIERDGGLTWEVPALKVGHAEASAGAGERGHAVLLGHVTSLPSGDVFKDLERARVGDTGDVFADEQRFTYTVAHARRADGFERGRAGRDAGGFVDHVHGRVAADHLGLH